MSALHGGESNAIDGITEADDAVSGDAIVSSWENSNIKIRRAKVTKLPVCWVVCILADLNVKINIYRGDLKHPKHLRWSSFSH